MTAAPLHVFVTGASSGIGAALARRYAGPDVRLTLTGRNRERLDTVAQACRTRGAETAVNTCDVRDAEAMRAFIEEIDGQWPIAMMIANAGVGGEQVIAGPSGEKAEIARAIFEINVIGVVNTIVPLLPRLVARGKGHVVIMSSLAAFVALPDAPAYSASKAAVRLYGEALRPLLAPRRVRVTVVCPGFVDTPMSASLPGPRPLLWSAERAADAIVAGLARGKNEICFPWALSMLAKTSAYLPATTMQRLRRAIRSRSQ
ncbi:MAG TPA: SDR family NAD(P)-dependent oxidoreductase [Rhizomicrobium sp.]|nr:SDR family NAD(P)-dependent oxidoreductase [Rhizomicrobium sp.]